ncbi:MAG: serine hydrolase [Patescibacteria group bacterium]
MSHNHHKEIEKKEFTKTPYIVVISILTIVIIGGVFWISRLQEELFRVSSDRYPLIDPARNFISQEHFLTTIEPLRKAVKAYVLEEKLQATVYIEYLNTGANIHVNPEFRYWPASLTKLPVSIAAMSAIEKGIWTLNTKLTLTEADRDPIASEIETLPAGTEFTVRELIERSLVRSDNTAYKVLLRNLPETEIADMIQAVGLDQFFNEEGKVGSKEFSRFFRVLYGASYLKKRNSQYLLSLLDQSSFTNFLREPIPKEVPFPHKFGFNESSHAFNDSGIVYIPNRPYLITVIIQGDGSANEEEKAREVMNHISKISYAYFSQAK